MKSEQNKLIRWIKTHKTELIIAGFSIAALIAVILCIKNRAVLKQMWHTLQASVRQTRPVNTLSKSAVKAPAVSANTVTATALSNTGRTPFEVSSHIRNLPAGWHASPDRIAKALDHNIILMNGQTWVDSYMKGARVA